MSHSHPPCSEKSFQPQSSTSRLRNGCSQQIYGQHIRNRSFTYKSMLGRDDEADEATTMCNNQCIVAAITGRKRLENNCFVLFGRFYSCFKQNMGFQTSLGVVINLVWSLTESSESTLPNILFVLVDDLGWNDVSFHGGCDFKTPNIDSLAENALQLTNYYVQVHVKCVKHII